MLPNVDIEGERLKNLSAEPPAPAVPQLVSMATDRTAYWSRRAEAGAGTACSC